MASLLTDHLATRARSLDFATLGLLLPNPDPILKAQGKDISTYRDLRNDALIGGCIRRRKSAVKALDWGLDKGQAASRVTKAVQGVLDGLDIERLIGQMLEATLYGYQPMEVTWAKVGTLMVPSHIEAKPPEWFSFDADARLRFKTRAAPLFGEELPDKKFLLPRQDPTYQNPYGFADLSMCFWPLIFKKGGLKFWLAFTEKFGSAFSVGKLPRSATPEERATLLDGLEKLIQDGVTVIPDDGSIELVEMAGKSASADLYEKLVNHCRGEIAIALLGQNQTTEANANRASATAGLEVAKDLRDGDAEIVAAAFNQLIQWICEINFGGTEVPTFSLWDQEAQDTLQADRDKSNYEAGARFTNAYFERAYGYEVGDLVEAAAGMAQILPPIGRKAALPAPANFAEGQADPTQAETDALMAEATPQWASMAEALQALVDQASTLPELQQSMVQAFGDLDSTELVKLMAAAMALAELKGMDDVRTEVKLPAQPPPAFAEPSPVSLEIAAAMTSMSASFALVANRPEPQPQAAPIINVAAPNVQFAEQPAPIVQVDVHVPPQAAPTVEVINQVQPAPLTVNNVHPHKSVQTFERDADLEILRATTIFESKE